MQGEKKYIAWEEGLDLTDQALSLSISVKEEASSEEGSIPFYESPSDGKQVRAYERNFEFRISDRNTSEVIQRIDLQIQREKLPCVGKYTGIQFGPNLYGASYTMAIQGAALGGIADYFEGIHTCVIQCNGLAHNHPFTQGSHWEDITSFSVFAELDNGTYEEIKINTLNAEALYGLLTATTEQIRSITHRGSSAQNYSDPQRRTYLRDLEAFCEAMAQVALDKIKEPHMLAKEGPSFGLSGEDTYIPSTDGNLVAYAKDGTPLDVCAYSRSLLRHIPLQGETEQDQNYSERFPFFMQITRSVEQQLTGPVAICEYKAEMRHPLLPPSHQNPRLREKIQISCKVSSSASRVQPPVNQSSWRDGVTVTFQAESDTGQNPIHLARTLTIPKEKPVWYEIKRIKGDYFTSEPITSDNSHLLLHIAKQLAIEITKIREHEDHKLVSKIQNPLLLQQHLEAEERLEAYILDLQRFIVVLKTIDKELYAKRALGK